MTKREAESRAWRKYYMRISQYERWRYFQRQSTSLVNDMERRVRGITDVEDESLFQEVIRAAKELNVLVQKYAGQYCTVKPEKPLGRPYGPDL